MSKVLLTSARRSESTDQSCARTLRTPGSQHLLGTLFSRCGRRTARSTVTGVGYAENRGRAGLNGVVSEYLAESVVVPRTPRSLKPRGGSSVIARPTAPGNARGCARVVEALARSSRWPAVDGFVPYDSAAGTRRAHAAGAVPQRESGGPGFSQNGLLSLLRSARNVLIRGSM
jgi:hypothetical protein